MNQALHARFKFTPLLALAAFAALVALPTLYASRSYVEGSARYGVIVVRVNDTLWDLAAAHAKPGANIQETVDEIAAVNHLTGTTIIPGHRLRIPQ